MGRGAAAATLSAALSTGSMPGDQVRAAEGRTVRVGIVGTGGRGRGLLATMLTMPDVVIPALCDINGEHLAMAVDQLVKAGHPEPEFGEQAGSVWVRFLPSGYIAPHRVTHDLTGRQRNILHVLSGKPSMPLRDIRIKMDNPPSDRRIREELLYLKKLGLVFSSGYGRGASWSLVRHENE